MSQKQYALPRGSRILVTAANSYIGSNIVDLLLELGFQVRGTVRAEKPWLNNLFEKKYGKDRFETVIVPGAEKEGAFDDVLDGVAGIIHVASDVSFNPDPEAVIPGVVKGVLNALEAASKHTSVKRFVLTSSSSAALLPPLNEEVVVDENTWNDSAVTAAWSKDTPDDQRPFTVYAASKTEGERAAWKWMKEEKRGFTCNAVLPNLNLGRILAPEIPGSTMGWTRDLLNGDEKVLNFIPPQWYIDVQDCARVHVVGLLDPAVSNERLFAFAGQFNWTDVIGIFHKLRPDRQLPDPPKNEGRDLSDIRLSKRAEALIKEFFGRSGWVSLEDSLAKGIVDIH